MYIYENFGVFSLCIKIKLESFQLRATLRSMLVNQYGGHARPSQARLHVRGVEIGYFLRSSFSQVPDLCFIGSGLQLYRALFSDP